ncbi:MAG: hypothetical protein IKS19_06970 [Clostridia bacterium]|nr:hypothetical protein [Clostridia bacterium]
MDECHMVDYEIKDDKITFEYSFCFYYDDTDLSESLETIMVTFNKREAKGWLRQSFLGLEGKDKNGKTGEIIVHPNEKNYFTLFFTGDYLGGEVNTDIKPYRIDYTMGIPDDDPYNDLRRAL